MLKIKDKITFKYKDSILNGWSFAIVEKIDDGNVWLRFRNKKILL